ncbi:hypothetical protein C2845_PM02G14070 [Panicum miliaceum]|uniref:Myb-like domain-containing protein n=1 Tax=Panicum miliaceum TaxID=4540 RepID=A0A3L6SCE7_PANMI|nr:hypothetical protein C2845_PM02G14070 [Panicum miliaceum]
MARMEDDRMEIQLLMTGPPNEANLYEILVGGTFDHNTHQMRYEQDARNGDGAEAVQKIHTDHEMGDYLEPSMLGCFSAPWRCCRSGTRMRSRSSWRAQVDKLFGSQYPCTSAGGRYRSKKNNDHRTEDEMIELVVGVSKRGIWKWSRVKDDYFSTSVRTAIHLKVQYLGYWRQHVPPPSIYSKDKWRNLVAACKANTSRKARKEKNTSIKKVSVQKTTELVVERFGNRILAMEAKHLVQKKK